MRHTSSLSALLWVSAAACGGATYEASVFEEGAVRYRAQAPGAGWDRVEVEDENDLAWRNASLGAVIQVNSTCDPDMDVPLTALRSHLLIGFTERETVSEELVRVDEREALRTHVVAKYHGVSRELLLTVMKKNDCVYDFALVAPPGDGFARAQAAYEGIIGSFATIEAP